MPDYFSLTRRPFVPGIEPPSDHKDAAFWFVIQKFQLLVEGDERNVAPPSWSELEALRMEFTQYHYLGSLNDVSCFAAEVDDNFLPPAGMRFQGLRTLYGLMDEDYFWVGGRAVQIVDWARTNRYCGRCGASTRASEHERSRECPACGLIAYPRLAPAIIVAVTHKGKILLARSHRHPPGFHSVLAGFVEPGETLEECVIREVNEEVGLSVTDLRYFGSQPWPFPHSLMIAFTCESLSDRISLQDSELAEAAWFAPDELPNIPPPLTISRHLIDAFAAGPPQKQ